MEKLQGLETQLEKSTNQKASLEKREKKAKEDASLVSIEVDAWSLFVSLLHFCLQRKRSVWDPLGKPVFLA